MLSFNQLINRLAFIPRLVLSALVLLALPTFSQAADPGLEFTLEPSKQIFSHSEGLVMIATWLAKRPVKLCLAKDLLGQMQVEITRSGTGKLALQPLVVQDNSKLYEEPLQDILLQTGQSIRRRVNLKRYQFADGEHWVEGDYTVKATFTLCPPEGGAVESKVPSRQAAFFMLMD
jgi:hypothetical protein